MKDIILKKYQKKTNEELLLFAEKQFEFLTPEAIDLLRSEFERRSLDFSSYENRESVTTPISNTSNDTEKKSNLTVSSIIKYFIAHFILLIILGIIYANIDGGQAGAMLLVCLACAVIPTYVISSSIILLIFFIFKKTNFYICVLSTSVSFDLFFYLVTIKGSFLMIPQGTYIYLIASIVSAIIVHFLILFKKT